MRETRASGSVEAVVSDHDPYSDFSKIDALRDSLCVARTWRPASSRAGVGDAARDKHINIMAACRRMSIAARSMGSMDRHMSNAAAPWQAMGLQSRGAFNLS
jgi:hypothetical protein